MTTRNKPSMTDAKKACAYVRASTSGEDRQRNSPDIQRDDIKRWAMANGIEVVAWFEERVSGATGIDDSPELLACMEAASKTGCGLVVASRRDRIARDITRISILTSRLAKQGIRLVSADDANWNIEDPSVALVRGVLDVFAAFELSQIRARTAKAHQKLRREGRKQSWTAPYGFELEDKRIVPVKQELAAMRQIFALRQSGMPFKTIAQMMNQSPYKPRQLSGRLGVESKGGWTLSNCYKQFQRIEQAMTGEHADGTIEAQLRAAIIGGQR